MKNPDIIFYTEWENLDTRKRYRIEVLPAFPAYGPAYEEEYSYKMFNHRTLLDTGVLEASLGKLPVGIMETPNIKLRFDLMTMNSVMRSNILKPFAEESDFLHLSPGGDPRFGAAWWNMIEVTNLWRFYEHNGTSWILKFAGVQRKTPGMKFDIQPGVSECVDIELMHVSRVALENLTPRLVRDTFYSDLVANVVATSNRLIDLFYYEEEEDPQRLFLTIEPATLGTVKFYMYSLTGYFNTVETGLTLYMQLFGRSAAATATISRRPHENLKAYKQNWLRNRGRGATLDPDALLFPGHVTETRGGIETMAWGLFHVPVEDGEESFEKYDNYYDMFKYMSGSFCSKLIYSVSEVDGELVADYKFARILEKFRTRSAVALRQIKGERLRFETAGNIQRGCEVNVDDIHLKDDDERVWFEEAVSIDSEQKVQIKMMLHNLLTIPNQGEALKSDFSTATVSTYQQWQDRGAPICSKLYYAEGSLPPFAAPSVNILKIHEACGFYLDESDTLYEISPDEYPIEAWGYGDGALNESDAAKRDAKLEAARLQMAASLITVQRSAGMPLTCARLLRDLFSQPENTLYKLTIRDNADYTPADIGDRGEMQPLYEEMDYVPTDTYLLSSKTPFGSDVSEIEQLAIA